MLLNWTDVLDGEIVNAAWALVQMLGRARTSRSAAADLDTAAWADTARLIKGTLTRIPASPNLPKVSEDEAARWEVVLNRHEVQGALQALLAVRLTDAPETQAAKAREAVRLALIHSEVRADLAIHKEALTVSEQDSAMRAVEVADRGLPLAKAEQDVKRIADRLSKYFDKKISALVANLEGRIGFAGLAQVRAEAYNSRIVALLGTLTDLVGALGNLNQGGQAEVEFIERYRRQVCQQHGKIEPPDFDRRRLVPIASIYVPTGIEEHTGADRIKPDPDVHPSARNVLDLSRLLSRTVLLGDPGGGKTTATNVLMHTFASDKSARIPFLVTLRQYAAKNPPERSVAGYIEATLDTLYQCKTPRGLIERLLLTGRATVLFDGLDELLDTSRRREVSERIEQFCSAYPLTSVLVTSRLVGYNQARLDDRQFICFRLSGFAERQVTEYVRKWFACQEGVPRVDAETKAAAFLKESSNAKDLRANPLLLSLMCILYRGSGSLPGDRPGIYAKCSELLLRKWDEQRALYQKIRADRFVESTLRYLAWWLFTREDASATATERALITETARFLHERGFESDEEAQTAAREFVEFCRGRKWVFNDAGTTANGEILYAFTHRTFVEYFAACHLAATSDTPEDLANKIVSMLGTPAWQVVGSLAIQINDRNVDQGADRLYQRALAVSVRRRFNVRGQLLTLLTDCLPGVNISPATARLLARVLLTHLRQGDAEPLLDLLVRHTHYQEVISDQLKLGIAELISSNDGEAKTEGLEFITEFCILTANNPVSGWAREQANIHKMDIIAKATDSIVLRTLALYAGIVSLKQAIAMPGGLGVLMSHSVCQDRIADIEQYPVRQYSKLTHSPSYQGALIDFMTIGEYVISIRTPPWVGDIPHYNGRAAAVLSSIPDSRKSQFNPVCGLGVAALIAINAEIGQTSRINEGAMIKTLPMPPRYKELFRQWARHKFDVVEFCAE